MDAEPKIIPLDNDGNIYAIQDARGNLAGTGSREVCEVMIYLVRKLRTSSMLSDRDRTLEPRRPNLRAAITI